MFEEYLQETYILDYKSESIQNLIKRNKYRSLEGIDCIREIYNFMRDEIKYFKPYKANVKASEVLALGKGGPYTKGILCMALLRGSGIPARLHIYKVYKHLMFGILDKKHLDKIPDELSHFVVEAYLNGEWIALEGIILDKPYIDSLKRRLGKRMGAYIGYGIGVGHFEGLNIDFDGSSVLVQSKAISKDVGIFSSPDEITNRTLCEFNFLENLFINRSIKKIRNHK